jgi:HEAT repeat protein/MFS family permease
MKDTRIPQFKTDGTPMTDADVRRGMRINIIAGCLGNVWGNVVGGMPLTMFMKALGASGVMIGLTSTVGQLAMALQIPSALLAERLPARKPYWGVLVLLHRLMWFIPAVLPLLVAPGTPWVVPAVVAVVAASSVLAQLGTAPWWSWMAEFVPPASRASFWGVRHSLVSVASLLGMLVAGWALDVFDTPADPRRVLTGFGLVFTAAAFFGVADVVVHLWVPEPKPGANIQPGHLLNRFIRPFANRDFLWLTLAMGIWTFGVGLIAQFSFVYLNHTFHIGYSAMSATVISGMIGASIAGFLWSYVMDRVGARNFGAVMMILAPAMGAAWFFMRDITVTVDLPFLPAFALPQPLLILIVVNIFGGLFYSGVGLAQVSLAAALMPAEGRTMAMAAHWSVVGAIGALGPVVGGLIMDWMEAHPVMWVMPTGTPFGFFHVLILLQTGLVWLVGVRILLAVRQREGEMAFRTALSSLQVGNPLRVFTGAYNVLTLLSSTTSDGRAGAVRKLGEDRLRIAVRDLIEKLDDPSAEVREEAAMALGRIGSPAAVEALVQKLDDPHVDLIPQIARALRQTHDQSSVDALIRHLRDSDRETVSETARTLGEIGDVRAAEPLMQVLQESRDSKVVSASSSALAQLGEMAAIYEILPRMQETENPVLKRSLAVAVADLIGEPGEFYRVLVREHRGRGTEAERLLGKLRDSVLEATRERLQVQGRALIEKTHHIEEAYAGRQLGGVEDALFDLSIGLAALHYGIEFGGDAEAFIETLIWHDARFGVGVWYLELMREARDTARKAVPPDDTDALLGIYALSRWVA